MKKTKHVLLKQQGFSMIEVLVTLAIIAVALLGIAGLQAHALKINKGSDFRNQAVFLSADIIERMEANKAEAVSGSYAVAAGAGAVSTACDTAACAGPALTAYDLANWQAAAVALLPGGVGAIALTTAGNPATYTVTVSWNDRATTGVGQAGANAKQETFSVTSVKTIAN